MASKTLTSVADVWPVGTTVSVYVRPVSTAWSGSGTPPGSVVTTAAVASAGSVVFTGLTDDTDYVAYASSRTVGFRTDPAAASAGVESDTAALAALATHTADNTAHGLTAALGAKAQALALAGVKTANYSAAANEYVPVDLSSASVTVTLPSAPADKTRVGVKIVTGGGAHSLTVACGGSDVLNKAGGATTARLTLGANQGILLQYASSTGIWYVQSTDTPVGGLDARYIRSPFGQVAASRAMVSGAVSGVSGRNYNTRLQHTTYASDIGGLRLVYTNFGSDLAPTNPVTVSASIEYPASTYWPVTFNGKKRITIDPGQLVISDIVGVDIPATTTFYTRSYWAARDVSNDKVVLTTNLGAAADGFTFSSTPEADHTLDGTAMTPGTGVAPAPAMVLAQFAAVSGVPVRVPCPVAVGDSILWGQGDSNDWRNGYWTRACDAAGIATINLGRSAELGQAFATFATSWRRRQLFQFATSVFIEYGTNDINNGRTLAQFQADIQTMVAYATRRGLPVFLGTVTPLTTSTDSWVTTTNQTPYGGVTARETIRKAYNAWVRAGVSGVTGYFEIADAVESVRDSGVWKANYTADGTHPNATAHAAIAAAIDVTRMP